ncbi:MAG: 1-(5-phosphoribosyl)-5-[(5-phosphoribosylamino)methylideneamino]imidazole-4-carboxamide isomerase [Polyangiaceae bacterium]|nr:1-(5-phosphoribosyl)-5-[(5-phosphoribosylamino)methylideneamino]imidazole-4-carboxamide isomerase [Polyangiaceae bacterium]
MELIPAIDLLAGQAVRLRQGRYDAVTVYSDDPAGLAALWRGRASRLHVVDLEGARAGQAVQRDLVQRLVSAFGPGVEVGGGVRNRAAFESYLALGVERVVLGTMALRSPELVGELAETHPGRVVLAVDARAGRVATEGWLEQSTTLAIDLVRAFAHLPIAAVLYTDIERDGMETGPNIEQTAALARDGGLPVIASGGVGTLEHLRALAPCPGVAAAIVGRALHEGRFSLEAALEACK